MHTASLTSYVTEAAMESVARTIKENMRWVDRNQVVIENWLLENGSGSLTVSLTLIVMSTILYFLK